MKDKNLMIAVIGCFAIAVLFILVIVWEIKKSIDYGQKVRRLSANVTKTVEDDNRDFSIYESIVGVDEREMILIPEGVFTRGSDRGGFDEKPEQEIYLDAFYVDKYEVTVKLIIFSEEMRLTLSHLFLFYRVTRKFLRHPLSRW